jgi:hypothetical protein
MSSQIPLLDEVRRLTNFVNEIPFATFYMRPSLRRAIKREQAKARQETHNEQELADTGIPREGGYDIGTFRAYCLTCEAFVQSDATQVHQEKSDNGDNKCDPGGFQHPHGVRWCRHIPAKSYGEGESPGRHSRKLISKLVQRVHALLSLLGGDVKSFIIHIFT